MNYEKGLFYSKSKFLIPIYLQPDGVNVSYEIYFFFYPKNNYFVGSLYT